MCFICISHIYKCITKILDLVSSNQTAFTRDTNISENILLAHELVKHYNRSKGVARCAIKADLKKDYDFFRLELHLYVPHISWNSPKVCQLVKECITTQYSITLNGSLVGYFHGDKGLRQGDPLSSNL